MALLQFEYTDGTARTLVVDMSRDELEGLLDSLAEGTGAVFDAGNDIVAIPPGAEGLRLVTASNLPEEPHD